MSEQEFDQFDEQAAAPETEAAGEGLPPAEDVPR